MGRDSSRRCHALAAAGNSPRMGDAESRRARFEALFRQHHRAVQAYARRRVGAEMVDDVVSETFLVAWRRLADMPENSLPWLLAVARNVAGTQRRGAERRRRLLARAQIDQAEGYEPLKLGSGDGRARAALAVLSEKDREALTLVAWDGLTPAQAAAALGEPAARFRQRLHRAGHRLRAHLEADPEGMSSTRPTHDHAPNGGLT